MSRLRAALIGHPVAHSLSPALHRAAGAACGIAVDYDLIDVPPGGVAAAVARLRGAGLAGVNITAPHKAEAAACADRLTPAARAIGVVNTLVFGAELLGDNTDGPGFRAALHPATVSAPPRAVVLGAGGSARAVVWALLDIGCPRVDVLNRTEARARRLCAAFGSPRLRPGPLADAAARMAGAGLLVDSLPDGAAAALGLPFEALAADARIHGLDYGHRADPLRAAVGGRRPFVDGLSMLAWQGVVAFERWTGVRPPIQPVLDALGMAADAAD